MRGERHDTGVVHEQVQRQTQSLERRLHERVSTSSNTLACDWTAKPPYLYHTVCDIRRFGSQVIPNRSPARSTKPTASVSEALTDIGSLAGAGAPR